MAHFNKQHCKHYETHHGIACCGPNRSLARWLVVIVALTVGCGEPSNRTSVTGRVTLDGEPLTEGGVSTKIDGGRGSSGQIQPDGTFELGHPADGPGAALGTHRVTVTAFNVDAGALDDDSVEISGPIRSLVPIRYSSPKTSGLSFEVTADGENDFTLELKSRS